MTAAAAPYVEGCGVKAAAFVAEVVRDTGTGPTWRELARAMDWPRAPYGFCEAIISGLGKAGWLEFTSKPRSLRPGPAAREVARRTRR